MKEINYFQYTQEDIIKLTKEIETISLDRQDLRTEKFQ